MSSEPEGVNRSRAIRVIREGVKTKVYYLSGRDALPRGSASIWNASLSATAAKGN